MKRFLAFLSVALIGCLCHAQISEDQAIREAKRYISALAPEEIDKQPVVLRDTMEVSGATLEYFHVQFEEVVVALESDGTFIGFYNMSGPALEPKRGGPDKYVTDEEAWRALEDVVANLHLNLPPGLERDEIRRQDGETSDFVYKFYMRPRPHGYDHSEGNYLAAELHRITGRVLGLGVSRGWTYEPPNVRVSESQAVERAVETFGGEPSEWRVQLKYDSMAYDRAPAYFRPMICQQVMRLMYLISSGRGTVMVDSVTGSVLDSWTVDAVGHSGKRAGAATQSRGGEQAGTPAEAPRSGPTSSTLTLAISLGAVFVSVGGVVLFRRARVRR